MGLPGRLALVGSGEYLPVMHDVEAWLLDGRPRRYVQLATAAAPEGDRSLAHWHELGRLAAERLGVQQVVIDVRTQDDAQDPRWADEIADAGLIYLSGGNPMFLATTLAGTAVWAAIQREWLGGASLAGCSAGAMALGGHVPEFRHPRRGGAAGLGLLPDVRVLPHFDRLSKWIPDFAIAPLTAPGVTLLGIDEDTALLGEPRAAATWEFRPAGRQSAWQPHGHRLERIDPSIELRVDSAGLASSR